MLEAGMLKHASATEACARQRNCSYICCVTQEKISLGLLYVGVMHKTQFVLCCHGWQSTMSVMHYVRQSLAIPDLFCSKYLTLSLLTTADVATDLVCLTSVLTNPLATKMSTMLMLMSNSCHAPVLYASYCMPQS